MKIFVPLSLVLVSVHLIPFNFSPFFGLHRSENLIFRSLQFSPSRKLKGDEIYHYIVLEDICSECNVHALCIF